MNGGVFKKLRRFRLALSWCLIISFLFTNLEYVFFPFTTPEAEAAQATIDPDASAVATDHIQTGSHTVFISDQVGYKFFRDAPGYCVYRKTLDGGATWSASTTVDSQTDCIMVTVWYDRWTPGDSGNYIHIATLDTSADDIFYNRLDTANSDNLLMGSSPVDAVTNSGNSVLTATQGSNYISITKGTDGTIYATANDASDSYVVECTTNCNLATGWTETGTNPLDLANDYDILVPLPGGNIMVIDRDVSLEDMRYKIWNNSTWSASWTLIDDGAADNTTYDSNFAVAVSSSSPGTLYLAYIASSTTLGTDDQIRTAKYDGSTWTRTANVLTGSTTIGLTNIAIGLDQANDDVYVAYSGRTAIALSMTANVYWKWASSSMMNWSAQSSRVNTLADDIYGLDLDIGNDQRVFTSWFASSTDDILGDTIADVYPGVHASGTGAQTANVNASTSNFYVGGKFFLYNTYKSFDVTGITLTESGTIDGSTNISNVKLLYEMDTTAPYDCASESYAGTESQFGSTDTNGFSGANGISAFTGTSVTLSTTTALCLYPVVTVLDNTPSNATLDISINDPPNDITVAGGTAGPASSLQIQGVTTVLNDTPTLVHYHWRNDNGSETTATSKTLGAEDTSFNAMQKATTTRLRVEVSNKGSSSTPLMQYRLEYAQASDVCSDATGWTDVGATGGDFDMFNTANLTDGNNTTDIAVASGGVTNDNTTFLTPNAGVKDSSSQADGIVLATTQFIELEYSIISTSTIPDGTTYCFRVTDAGNPLFAYSQYPRASISADVTVSATGTQTASANLPAKNFYTGGAYVITENSNTHNITSITLTASGTINAQTDLSNVRIYYEKDITAPYDCGSESYGGTELQYGATSTGGFSSANGTTTFTGSVSVSTTSAMCVYTMFDTTTGAQNAETFDLIIDSPATDIVASGGATIGPTTARDINGFATFVGGILTQVHYHFRNDNGSETTATSMTSGAEDTTVSNIAQSTPFRIRIEVSNRGTITSDSVAYKLEYGTKVTTCSAVGTWTDVGAGGGAFDLYNSTNISDAAHTTDIAVASGGVTNDKATFLTPNYALKDASSTVATTTLSSTQFIETEYSVKQTTSAGYDTTYCFRLSANGSALNSYVVYPELTTAPKRDFEIQRGTVTITGTTATITAGVDYVAPSASTSAFVRITNVSMTGAGHNTGVATAQNSTDVTAYITNPTNIMNSITFARSGSTNNTRVSWEIVEFIGTSGSDNEMIVRGQSYVAYTTTGLVATGTAVSTVVNNSKVVVFITGQSNPLANSTAYNTGISTSQWSSASKQPVFTRGAASSNAVITSYAVVEFTGQNWAIQRSEHIYTNAGTTETEPITALNSLSRTFIHTQKRNGSALNGQDEFGHEVWLSSIGYISFFLEAGATTPSGQASVVWVIENTQTSQGAMEVTRSNGSTNAGTAPLSVSVSVGKTLTDLTNASIFVNARNVGTGTTYPRPMAGITITSSTTYQMWRSNTGSQLTYRTEIVEWPTAGLAFHQDYYRLYADNNALKPTDPWPVGGVDLGENTAITAADTPPGDSAHLRIRMSLRVANATFPAETVAFKLQYGELTSTCSAIPDSEWFTLGDTSSSTVWRGYNATGTTDGTLLSGDPPTVGDLVLSVSDVAGSLEETNNTTVNSFAVADGNDIEYDWHIQENGAAGETYYCFRMVESDGTKLATYDYYPQIRTASFTPKSQRWRWYSDVVSETPTTTLANENTAPVNIPNGQGLKLRLTVKETQNISRDNVRFKLQYSEYSNFAQAYDVVATSSCMASSTWCYYDGGGVDNAKISSSTLSDALSCVAQVGDGCGTHNESPTYMTGFRHKGSSATEYEFTLRSAGPRVNRVYYFRLYDMVQDVPVITNTGESYPSLATEGASLTFMTAGLTGSTVTEGVTLDATTTVNSINFGTLGTSTPYEAGHRLTVDTDGTEGYQVYMYMLSDLISDGGSIIKPITGTNESPLAWSTGCLSGASSCFGYHVGDDTLQGGSTRFAPLDTYARINTTTPEEVAYSSQPLIGDTNDIIYRILVRDLQEAGQYQARIEYISVPIF